MLSGLSEEQYLFGKEFGKIQSNVSYEANMKKLLSKRIDLWAVIEFTAYDLMRKNKVNPAIVKKPYCTDEISKEGTYLAFSRDTPDEIVEKFKKAENFIFYHLKVPI